MLSSTVDYPTAADPAAESAVLLPAPTASLEGKEPGSQTLESAVPESQALVWGERAIATVERVSLSSEGEERIGFASTASLSSDGRFVAFSSTADNLVPEDTNGISDIFVRDRLTGLVERISRGEEPAYNPVIAANGQFVAFQSNTEDGDRVFVYDRERQVTESVLAESVLAETADGETANNLSHPDISANGRFVVFESDADNLDADNLVEGDANELSDIFVRDRQINTLESITSSVTAEDAPSNGSSSQAAISANGRYVAFASAASNLLENDTNGTTDIFVFDRDTQVTERVSITSTGEESNGFSRAPSISADGRYISYDSLATNLVENDTNQKGDVFVYDRLNQTTSRASVSSEGEQSNNFSFNHGISADGQYVSYSSVATNLVTNDTNRVQDVFVFNRQAQTTTRISVDAEGRQGNRDSRESVFSADGRFVAFQSNADTLTNDDTNGRTDIFVYDFDPRQTPDQTMKPVANAPTIDLTGMEAPTVTASIEVTRSAGYNNTVGWYVIENEQGGVKDALTGDVINPEDEGYAQAALENRLALNLTGNNSEVTLYEADIATGSLLSTFIISNGSIESLLDADTLNDPYIFFGYLGANSDQAEHVQQLADNTFGYEDLLGGGDRDFDDMVVKMSFA